MNTCADDFTIVWPQRRFWSSEHTLELNYHCTACSRKDIFILELDYMNIHMTTESRPMSTTDRRPSDSP